MCFWLPDYPILSAGVWGHGVTLCMLYFAFLSMAQWGGRVWVLSRLTLGSFLVVCMMVGSNLWMIVGSALFSPDHDAEVNAVQKDDK